jgi:hypothetical protein
MNYRAAAAARAGQRITGLGRRAVGVAREAD